MNALKTVLDKLDSETSPLPKRIMVDVLTLREAAADLAELQRVAKEAIDIYADRCRADFGGSSKKEEAKITELRAALKGETE